jgi:hypothetical protein
MHGDRGVPVCESLSGALSGPKLCGLLVVDARAGCSQSCACDDGFGLLQVLSRTLQPLERLPLGFPLVRPVDAAAAVAFHGATAGAAGRVLVLGAAGLSTVRLLPLRERVTLLQEQRAWPVALRVALGGGHPPSAPKVSR